MLFLLSILHSTIVLHSSNKTTVLPVVFQAVLPTPRGEVSVFYYKSKLSTFNFTISNIVKSSTYCYVWHEAMKVRLTVV